MRYLLLLFLVSFFVYALALVILNHTATGVNLIFTQMPEMNLGLLLIMSIFLGFCIGMIVAVLLFKVLQKQLELNALKKKNILLTTNLDKITAEQKQFLLNEKQQLDDRLHEITSKDEKVLETTTRDKKIKR